MIVKLPGGFYRMLLSDRGEAAGPNVTPEQGFMRLVNKHFDGVTLGDVVWHSKWQSFVRLAHTYRNGRVFLAGDSAHIHSTTGGQGLNCCMQDAYNLGWKLAFVVKKLAHASLLDTYEAERRPIAEQVIWAASSLHEIFMGHGKDIAERAQKIRDPEFLEAVVGRCSGISYTYRDQAQQPTHAHRSRDRRPRARRRPRPRPHAVRFDAPSLVHVDRGGGARRRAGGPASEPERARAPFRRRARAARHRVERRRSRNVMARATKTSCCCCGPTVMSASAARRATRTRSRRACTSGSRFEVLRLGPRRAALTAARRADILGAAAESAHRNCRMDFVYFLGRFHVLALHLPIGIIVALCVLEILSRKERYRYLEAASPYLWGATALTALVTVLLGFMHFAEGSFTGPSADQHRFFGTVVAVVATGVALLRVGSFASSYKPLFLPASIVLARARLDHGALRRQLDPRVDLSRRIRAAAAALAGGPRAAPHDHERLVGRPVRRRHRADARRALCELPQRG